MIIEIDQSGKVEQSNRLTVVAYGGEKELSVMISAIEKQRLLATMRLRDYPRRIFVYRVFAGLVYLLVSGQEIDQMIIDREYAGHEGITKDILRSLYRKFHRSFPIVTFAEIGKKSAAHRAALAVYRGDRKADRIVKSDDIVRLFYTK